MCMTDLLCNKCDRSAINFESGGVCMVALILESHGGGWWDSSVSEIHNGGSVVVQVIFQLDGVPGQDT